jgi:hypothetical protein
MGNRQLRNILGGGRDVRIGEDPVLTSARGVVISNSALAIQEHGNGVIRHTRVKITALSVTMTDATTAGSHGTQQLYTFPAKQVCVVAASIDLSIARVSTGLSATAAIVAGVGSAAVATDNGALTTTEQDIVASTAATLSSGANTGVSGRSPAGGATFAASTVARLNFAVPDAGTSANDALTVTGFVDLFWFPLND